LETREDSLEKFGIVTVLLLTLRIWPQLSWLHRVSTASNLSVYVAFFLQYHTTKALCSRWWLEEGPWIGFESVEERHWKAVNFVGLLVQEPYAVSW